MCQFSSEVKNITVKSYKYLQELRDKTCVRFLNNTINDPMRHEIFAQMYILPKYIVIEEKVYIWLG